ncbi:MAG: hypothetical protein ACUVRL_08525 [Candidatus Saccharicenans sp.]|uniref:hypothetical protein n=1 Tax=Candidatus Saccharicenans sp. TaxID=2819258 RepID=UPI00404947AD
MRDLFNNSLEPKEMICNIYHDEREIPAKWLYHGFLFMPLDCEDLVFKSLIEKREETTWQKEIHFADLKKTRKMNELATRWINLFCCSHHKLIYFYLLGIDYTNLEKKLWYDRATRDYKIYNRFFQIGIYGAI